MFMGQKTWDEILPNFAPFAKDLLDNLLWWTNATKAARDAERARSKDRSRVGRQGAVAA